MRRDARSWENHSAHVLRMPLVSSAALSFYLVVVRGSEWIDPVGYHSPESDRQCMRFSHGNRERDADGCI